MRILLITTSYPTQGDATQATAGLFVHAMVQELLGQGHEVLVVYSATGAPPTRAPGAVYREYRGIRLWGRGKAMADLRLANPADWPVLVFSVLSGLLVTLASCHRFRPELALAFWALPSGLFAAIGKLFFGVPFRSWCLGSDLWVYSRSRIGRVFLKSVLGYSDRVFADGPSLIRIAEQVSVREVEYLPMVRRLTPAQGAAAKGPYRTFLYVGRMHPNKGPDVLVEAIARLAPEARNQSRFHLVGDGPIREQVRQLVEKHGLTSMVTFENFADEKRLAQLIADCDFLVIPSRVESVPVILSDALQLGRPVIAVRVGDLPAVLDGRNAGLLCDPDSESLAQALTQAVQRGPEAFAGGVRQLSRSFAIEEVVARLTGTPES